MHHQNYYEVAVKNNYGLGLALGEKFRKKLEADLNRQVGNQEWEDKVNRSKKYLEVSKQYFPQYIEELKGCAKGGGTSLTELWALSIEDELGKVDADRCTSIVTNRGGSSVT